MLAHREEHDGAVVAAASHGSEVINLGPLRIMPGDRMAWVNGRLLLLSRREMHLLIELARHSGRIVERDHLSRLAWGKRLRAGDRSVDVYVRKLRVKLEQAAPGWRFIHTHVGFGYRLTPERTDRPRQLRAVKPRLHQSPRS